MEWKDHLKGLEQMRDSTRPSYCKAPSSSSRSRSSAYATGGHVSPSHSRGEERAVPQTRRRQMQQLAAQGRYGDTELAAIGPRTAKTLDELIHGGRKQRNPRTGMREFCKYGQPNCTIERPHQHPFSGTISVKNKDYSQKDANKKYGQKASCPHQGCGKGFASTQDLSNHVKLKHTNMDTDSEASENEFKNYVSPQMNEKHFSHLSHKSKDPRLEMANKSNAMMGDRAKSNNVPPASTMIGMNNLARKKFVNFMKQEDTQDQLRDNKTAKFDIPTNSRKSIVFHAISTGPKGMFENKAPGTFKSLRFKGEQSKKNNTMVANHFVGIDPEEGESIVNPSAGKRTIFY